MSHSVEINNTLLELLLVTEQELNANHPSVLSLYQAIKDFGSMAGISEITFSQDGSRDFYTYDVQRKDAKTFASKLLFDADNDTDPDITLSVPVAWPASELIFAVQPVGRILIDLRAAAIIESFNVVFA